MSNEAQIARKKYEASKDGNKACYTTKALVWWTAALFVFGSLLTLHPVGGLFLIGVGLPFTGIFVYESACDDFEKEFEQNLKILKDKEQEEYRKNDSYCYWD